MAKPFFRRSGKHGFGALKYIKWSQEAGSQSTLKMPLSCPKNGERVTVLLLEILNETGAEGTQVQIPSKVIDEYFQVPTIGHQTIELKFSKKPLRPAVICHFPNNTHRISFPELANIKRPLLMSFKKIKNSVFGIELFKGKQYKKIVRLCTNQTRSAARRWEILRA
jgi:hypothetical protein